MYEFGRQEALRVSAGDHALGLDLPSEFKKCRQYAKG